MATTDIELLYEQGDKSCSILVRSGLLRDLKAYLSIEDYSQIVVLTDENVARDWIGPLKEALGSEISVITLAAGETEKSLHTAEFIWKELAERGCDRHSLLMAFGGGVIGDIGGFVASLFARGMPFVQLPTSLMAQVDSSVGGKTAVNMLGVKNAIGTFYPPDYVFVDPDFLQTLPQREVVSGFAEVVKHALLFDRDFSEHLLQLGLSNMIGTELEGVVSDSIRMKVDTVKKDPFEQKGERQLLNFGHTVGHALESLSLESDTPLTHGEAVALGILCETEISRHLGHLTPADVDFVRKLLSAFCLPTQSSLAGRVDELLERISFDKKSRAGKVRWTLLEDIGQGRHSVSVSDEVVRGALRFIEEGEPV